MMNYAILLSILNLILLSRLRLILRDEGINRKDLWIIGGIPLLVLPFLQVNLTWFLLLIYLLVHPLVVNYAEKSAHNLNRSRGLILLMHIVILGLFCSPLFNLMTNTLPENTLRFVNWVFIPTGNISLAGTINIQVFLFGFLMVLNEMNIALRYLFRVMGLESLGKKGEEVDQEEYNTGRLIGLLERIFVFLFVLLSQYTAIGFILAAKGVARFQDFKSRTFAEYVLIGTLLSTLLAMAVGYFVRLVI
jgi:hypothetical protein